MCSPASNRSVGREPLDKVWSHLIRRPRFVEQTRPGLMLMAAFDRREHLNAEFANQVSCDREHVDRIERRGMDGRSLTSAGAWARQESREDRGRMACHLDQGA